MKRPTCNGQVVPFILHNAIMLDANYTASFVIANKLTLLCIIRKLLSFLFRTILFDEERSCCSTHSVMLMKKIGTVMKKLCVKFKSHKSKMSDY